MPIRHEAYSIYSDKLAEGTTVTLHMHRDVNDDATIHAIADALKAYLAKKAVHAPVDMVIRLEECETFTISHVVRTVGVLLGEKDALLSHVRASCVLLRPAMLHNALSTLFARLYTPVRPFSIVTSEAAARAFLAQAG